MSDNIYAPPQNNDAQGPTSRDWYLVSGKKFAALFIATMGIYGAYWFYLQWQAWRTRSGDQIWPIPRAIFSVFFTHSLFAHIDEYARDKGSKHEWEAKTTATFCVIFSVIGNLLQRSSDKLTTSVWMELLAVACVMAAGFFIYQAQITVNIASGDPQGKSNDRFSSINIFWLVTGTVLWLMAGLGLYMMMNQVPGANPA